MTKSEAKIDNHPMEKNPDLHRLITLDVDRRIVLQLTGRHTIEEYHEVIVLRLEDTLVVQVVQIHLKIRDLNIFLLSLLLAISTVVELQMYLRSGLLFSWMDFARGGKDWYIFLSYVKKGV